MRASALDVSAALLALVALIRAATAAFLYTFMGMFLPAHILMPAAILGALAGLTSRTVRM